LFSRPNLKVGAVDDALEQEADQIDEEVNRMGFLTSRIGLKLE